MSKKRRQSARREKAAPAAPDIAGAIAAGALLLAIACAGLVVDSGADNSFDAPKRLTTLVCTAAAALAAFGFARWRSPLAGRPASARAAAACVLFAAAAVLASAFFAIVAVNAAVSFLQARDLYRPFPLITRGSREATGAFVGNPGSLALALALCAVACLGLVLFTKRRWPRAAAGIGIVVFAGGLLANRNLTSLSALVAGAGILLLARFGRRAALPLALMLLFVGAGILAYSPMRQRAAETLSA